jgi:hypothetical protein
MAILMPTTPDPKVESLFREWNLRFTLLRVPLADIVNTTEQQARIVAHRAIPENVERYTEHMREGAPFPPIVLRSPRLLLDGNTRLAAATKLRLDEFPAYVVEDIASTDVARNLSGALNQLNGQPLTVEEAQAVAISMMTGDLSMTVNQVARYVGRSSTQVSRWRKSDEATRHASRLGIADAMGRVSHNQRERLADVQLDEPFRRLTELVADSKPGGTELNKLVRDVAKAASEAQAIELIDFAAADWHPTGPDGRVVRNKKAQQARMNIGALLKLQPVDLYDPAKAVDDRIKWEALRDHIDLVLLQLAIHGVNP